MVLTLKCYGHVRLNKPHKKNSLIGPQFAGLLHFHHPKTALRQYAKNDDAHRMELSRVSIFGTHRTDPICGAYIQL